MVSQLEFTIRCSYFQKHLVWRKCAHYLLNHLNEVWSKYSLAHNLSRISWTTELHYICNEVGTCGQTDISEVMDSWQIMRFMVFTAVKAQVEVFWVVLPCSVVVGYQHFGWRCCLHLQDEVNGSEGRKDTYIGLKCKRVAESVI